MLVSLWLLYNLLGTEGEFWRCRGKGFDHYVCDAAMDIVRCTSGPPDY